MTQNLKQFQTKFILRNVQRVTIIFTKFGFDMATFLLPLFNCCNFCQIKVVKRTIPIKILTHYRRFFLSFKRDLDMVSDQTIYNQFLCKKMVYLCIFSDLPSHKFIERDSSFNFFCLTSLRTPRPLTRK